MPAEARRHVNQAINDLSIKVRQSQEEYQINKVIFPEKNVEKMSDVYYVYNVADNFRTFHDIRANRSESNGIQELGLSQVTYNLAEHSLHEYVSDRDIENSDKAVSPIMDAMEDVQMGLIRNKELACAEMILTTAAYGSGNLLNLSSNSWSYATTTSDPIEDMDIARENIQGAIGKVPNGMVLGFKDHNVLKDHSAILDRIKYSERGIVTEDILSAVFGLTNYTVGKGLYRTTAPGISATVALIFNNSAVVYYNEPNPGLKSSNFGMTLQRPGVSMKTIRDEHKASDKHEMSWFYEQRIVLSSAGFLIKGIQSSTA